MSVEYIAAALVGLAVVAILGLAALAGVALLVAKLWPSAAAAPANADPALEAAQKLVAVVDSGRLLGAKQVVVALQNGEGEAFAANVSKSVGPKDQPAK